MSHSDSCLWTITGNNSDFTTGLTILMNNITGLNVSVFTGPTFLSASLVVTNVSSNFQVYVTIINNTYILVSPYQNSPSNSLNMTYFTIKNLYNYTFL